MNRRLVPLIALVVVATDAVLLVTGTIGPAVALALFLIVEIPPRRARRHRPHPSLPRAPHPHHDPPRRPARPGRQRPLPATRRGRGAHLRLPLTLGDAPPRRLRRRGADWLRTRQRGHADRAGRRGDHRTRGRPPAGPVASGPARTGPARGLRAPHGAGVVGRADCAAALCRQGRSGPHVCARIPLAAAADLRRERRLSPTNAEIAGDDGRAALVLPGPDAAVIAIRRGTVVHVRY